MNWRIFREGFSDGATKSGYENPYLEQALRRAADTNYTVSIDSAVEAATPAMDAYRDGRICRKILEDVAPFIIGVCLLHIAIAVKLWLFS